MSICLGYGCLSGLINRGGSSEITLRHLNFGSTFTALTFKKLRLRCPHCGVTRQQAVPFQAQSIDEFKLHDGHKYATHIIDLKTGHILWIAHGKKKQVVYDFIDHVGLKWRDHVEAIACDMNLRFSGSL